MPIYEYTCENCQNEFELLIRGNQVPRCPSCGQTKLQKQLSVPAAHTSSSRQLPVCSEPFAGTCGRPECEVDGCPMR